MSELAVIAPEGELDIARVGEFRDKLSEAGREPARRLVVDLTAVSFIDSSALGAIVELQNRPRRGQREVVVVAPEGTAVAVMLTPESAAGFETRDAALDDLQP